MPPGLQIHPIGAASAAPDRRWALLLSGLTILLLLRGAQYLFEHSRREASRDLKAWRDMVAVTLQEEEEAQEPPGGGRPLPARDEAESPSAAYNPASMAVHQLTQALAPAPERQDEAVPIETPKELPAPRTILPPVAGGGLGLGSGTGSGAGTGAGSGSGGGRKRGPSWIHPAQGESFQVTEELADIVKMIDPEYPITAQEARISGDVVVEVTIDENGKPTKLRLVEGHPVLAAATMKVLPLWKFAPVRHKNQKSRATYRPAQYSVA